MLRIHGPFDVLGAAEMLVNRNGHSGQGQRFLVAQAGRRDEILRERFVPHPSRRGGHHHGRLKGGVPEDDPELGIAFHGDGFGRGPAVHQTRAKALDHMDQNHLSLGTGRVCGVHDPTGHRIGHHQEAHRHRAGAQLVQFSIVNRLGRKKTFHHLAVGLDQPLSRHVEKSEKLPGEGIGRVFSDGAGADCHGRRRPMGLCKPIVGVEDRHFYGLGDGHLTLPGQVVV